MAEDKKIRVSADATPLQELRQNVQSLWNDFTKMENNFKDVAEETLEVIRGQIDLLKERNNLNEEIYRQNNIIQPEQAFNEEKGSYNRNREIVDYKEERDIDFNGRDDDFADSNVQELFEGLLEGIFQEIIHIASTLEKGQRDKINKIFPGLSEDRGGDDGTPPEPPQRDTDSEGRGKRDSNTSIPTSLQDILRFLPGGGLLASLLLMNSQQAKYETGQYGAQNEFQRYNQQYNHWLNNMLTFGASGAEGQRREIGRLAAAQNDQSLKEYSALHGTSWQTSFGRQLTSNFDENKIKPISAFSDLTAREQNSTAERNFSKLNDFFLGLEEKAFGWTGKRRKEWDEARERREFREEIKEYEKTEDKSLSNFEYQNWASKTLGLSISDYLNKVTSLEKSGVKSENTNIEDINQLLIAQRLRGLSDQEASSVLSSTRYDRSGFKGANVVQAFDNSLQNQGYDNQYIAATLSEHLSQFNRSVDNLINKTGSIDTEAIVKSMTAVQSATGMEGRQLERVQSSISGQNVSQDDVTQALLMRTTQNMYGGQLSYPELMSKMEKMGEDTQLQAEFIKTLQKLSGSDTAQFSTVLKSVFKDLSWTDVNALGKAGTVDEIIKALEEMKLSTKEYSAQAAEETVSPQEASDAATKNKHIIDGVAEVLQQRNMSIKEILENIKKPIPVMITNDSGEKISMGAEEMTDFYQKVKNISLSPETLRELRSMFGEIILTEE